MKSWASFFIIRWRGKRRKIIHKTCWWMAFLYIVRWGEEKTTEARLNPKKVEVESVEEGKAQAWQLSTYLDHAPFERAWGGGVEAHGMLFKLPGTYLSFGTWIEDLSRQEKSHIPNHGLLSLLWSPQLHDWLFFFCLCIVWSTCICSS